MDYLGQSFEIKRDLELALLVIEHLVLPLSTEVADLDLGRWGGLAVQASSTLQVPEQVLTLSLVLLRLTLASASEALGPGFLLPTLLLKHQPAMILLHAPYGPLVVECDSWTYL